MHIQYRKTFTGKCNAISNLVKIIGQKLLTKVLRSAKGRSVAIVLIIELNAETWTFLTQITFASWSLDVEMLALSFYDLVDVIC